MIAFLKSRTKVAQAIGGLCGVFINGGSWILSYPSRLRLQYFHGHGGPAGYAYGASKVGFIEQWGPLIHTCTVVWLAHTLPKWHAAGRAVRVTKDGQVA